MSHHTKHHTKTPLAIERAMSPFSSLHKAVDEAVHNFYHMFETPDFDFERLEKRNLFPSMDVVEADDHFTFELEMPGMGGEDMACSS